MTTDELIQKSLQILDEEIDWRERNISHVSDDLAALHRHRIEAIQLVKDTIETLSQMHKDDLMKIAELNKRLLDALLPDY